MQSGPNSLKPSWTFSLNPELVSKQIRNAECFSVKIDLKWLNPTERFSLKKAQALKKVVMITHSVKYFQSEKLKHVL